MARHKQDGLFYFPLDTDFFYADKRIKRLHTRYGNDGLLLYIYLLTEIYRNGYYIRWDAESVEDTMDDLHLTEGFIEQVMTFLFSRSLLVKSTLAVPDTIITPQKEGDGRPRCELVDSGNGQKRAEVITSPGIQKRYQEAVRSRKRDVYVNEEIWLLKENETASHIKVAGNENKSCGNNNKSCGNENKSCGNDVKKSKEKKSKVNNKNTMCRAEALALFEKLWKQYPVKKGKGQISDVKKIELLKIGFDEMSRAIERYISYVGSIDYLHYQNGGTFFNTGYVDYLDANYEPDKDEGDTKKKNSAGNFPEREYDFKELERQLLDPGG